MKILEVKATEKIEECWDLLMSHREELATHKHIMILKPDIKRYKLMEDKNSLLTLALYDNDKIVGYSVTILTNALHYQDLSIAANDIIFLRKDLRGGMWGIKLIKETERLSKQRGAKFITFHGKENTKFNDIMPRLGYGVQDILFSKEL